MTHSRIVTGQIEKLMQQRQNFNFHSVRSVLITKLRTRTGQNAAKPDYKINTGSDGNLISINIFRMLFPRMPIAKLNKYTYKKDRF